MSSFEEQEGSSLSSAYVESGEPSLITVGSEEDVDRSIRLVTENFSVTKEGTLRVTASAFGDKDREPSFYRRRLTEEPPYSDPPRFYSPSKQFLDVVVTLQAGAIRLNTNPFEAESGEGRLKTNIQYVVDIKPDLSNDQHKAHAVVYGNPRFASNRVFGLIKEKLARIANERIAAEGWPITPDPAFVRDHLSN